MGADVEIPDEGGFTPLLNAGDQSFTLDPHTPKLNGEYGRTHFP